MSAKKTRMFLVPALAAAGLSFTSSGAGAFSLWGPSAPLPVYKLDIDGRAFVPPTLSVPTGQKFKLIVSNKNAAPSEFESFTLHREQVVTAGSQTIVFLGPLQAGSYGFFDDFQSGVTGTLKVVPAQAAAKQDPAAAAKTSSQAKSR
ncbi:MAG TPA: cupredoxin domain-containing protein [Elusimicrobiota bacterium]|nr:cupredoxin domain-containing protein [Elusimicrobiota bacterium]